MENSKTKFRQECANSSSLNNSLYALTTVDNPYNPFSDFTNWLLYDNDKGYGTCQYLARIAHVSSIMTEYEVQEETERAIDEIVSLNPVLYKKVVNEFYDEMKSF